MHAIRSWRDLKNRLDSDRRCYAFFHPRMPGEPLIFVEVALVEGLAGNVQDLLDEKAPAHDPAQADTAIFYSISNCQTGLAGISFGNFLIKRVSRELSREFRNLKTFATLSPIPGFRRWLDAASRTRATALLTEEARAPRWLPDQRGSRAAAVPELLDAAELGRGAGRPTRRCADPGAAGGTLSDGRRTGGARSIAWRIPSRQRRARRAA